MSGNTRGKLKEKFEGIHKNLDWSVAHCAGSLELIAAQLQFTEEFVAAGDDKEKQQAVLLANPMYQGIKALGEAIQTLDELAGNIYKTF